MKKFSKLAFVLPLALTTAIYASPFDGDTTISDQDMEVVNDSVVRDTAEKISTSVKDLPDITIDLSKYIGKTGVVRAETVNCRTKEWGDIVSVLSNGTKVDIKGASGDWFIFVIDGKKAYVHSKWVEVKGYNRNYPDDGVLSEDSEVFDSSANPIGKLSEKDNVEILANSGSYWKIKYKDNEAYVLKNVVEIDPDFEETNDNDDDIDESDEPSQEVDVDEDDDSNVITLEDDEDEVYFFNPGEYTVILKDKKEEVKAESSTTEVKKTETKKTTLVDKIKNKIKKITKTIKKDKSSKKNNINKSNSKLKPLLKGSKVTVSRKLTRTVGSTWDTKGLNYTHVQGFCTDGTYWYVALMTSGGDEYYTNQQTKLLKIRIKDKKVLATQAVGKIGHSNTLTYKPKNNKILSATCTKKKSYVCQFNASDLGGMKKIYLKNNKGKQYKDRCFASFSYDPVGDQYIVKMSNKSLGFFDSNFKLKKTVSVKHLKINDKMTGQAITCDGENIFSVCNNLSCSPRINYILCYDINGNYLHKLTFKKELGTTGEKPEMEQLTCYNGQYWSLTNVNGKFRIHKIKLR